jgi:predicted O-methyltransferase YrrM
VSTPQRSQADTDAIAEYNRRISQDPRLTTAIVPLRDGVALSVRRAG